MDAPQGPLGRADYRKSVVTLENVGRPPYAPPPSPSLTRLIRPSRSLTLSTVLQRD